MGAALATRVEVDGFEEVTRLDLGGTVAFLAVHTRIGGRSFGGIRIRDYPNERAALDDALALARAMSRKVAIAGIEGGGAKTVVVQPRDEDRELVVRRLGEHVESLGGAYCAGGDLGFGPADLEILRGATRWVACGDLATATAKSIALVMRAIAAPRTTAIQGLGAVGGALATMLLDEGVRVVGAEIRDVPVDPRIVRLPPDAIWDAECDVFAPCAAGGVLDASTIERLKCRVLCVGANNPLASVDAAERLVERGIVFVPDFIANAGATVVGASQSIGEAERIDERMQRLVTLAQEVVDRARREGRSPHHVAVELADELVSRALRSATSRTH